MQDHSQLGDTPPEVFRDQLHQLVDWIADFREGLGNLPVAPNDKPGAIRAKYRVLLGLSTDCEGGEPFSNKGTLVFG